MFMQIELWTLDRIRPYENNPRICELAKAFIHRSCMVIRWCDLGCRSNGNFGKSMTVNINNDATNCWC